MEKTYNSNGYIFLKSFFKKEDIQKILDEAKYAFYLQFKRLNLVTRDFKDINEEEFNKAMFTFFEQDFTSFSNTGKQVQHLISLHQLSLNEEVIKVLNNVGLKRPLISTRPVLYFNHPKLSKEKVYHTVDAHQDWRSMQGSLNSVVIWVPLIDVTKDLGALQIISGSHKLGLAAKGLDKGFGFVELSENEKSKFVDVEVQQGDALLFSSFLIHQSGNNITNSPRWSCHFRYNDLEEETFINRGFPHPYIYKPDPTLLTENFPSLKEIEKIFKDE